MTPTTCLSEHIFQPFRTLPTSQIILQPFRCFTYITAHSPTLLLLHLHHSSFSNPSFASPTSQALHLIHLASRPCHRTATPTGSRPCNWLQCKTCPIHHPANSFTSSCINITYPMTTHDDCKCMNLIYKLQCIECNDFHIRETHRSLSDWMNGHRFTTTVSNSDLPVAIHTQSHLILFERLLHTPSLNIH